MKKTILSEVNEIRNMINFMNGKLIKEFGPIKTHGNESENEKLIRDSLINLINKRFHIESIEVELFHGEHCVIVFQFVTNRNNEVKFKIDDFITSNMKNIIKLIYEKTNIDYEYEDLITDPKSTEQPEITVFTLVLSTAY